MMCRTRRLLAPVTLASALAACSPTQTACSLVAPPINFANPQLLYPIPGAVGVPDNAKFLVLATTSQVTLAGNLSLTAPGVNQPLVQGAVPSPLPSPMASPPPGASEFGAALPPLAPHKTYNVTYVLHAAVDPCAPTNTTANLGSFTTR
jgi:hypothetical protein